MGDTPSQPHALSAAKLQILSHLLKKKGAGATRDQVITRRPDLVRFPPLSFAQQRLWFLSQLESDNSAYNVHTGVRLDGRLSVPALEWTLNEIVRRHEVLRTTFQDIDGEPVQVIAPEQKLVLHLVDLQAIAEPEREQTARRIATAEALRPFNLARDLALRATLLRLSPESHIVLLTMYHVVSDAWSRALLVKEVIALYQAYLSGKPSGLPELPIQYADFAVWQRNWLQGEVLQRQLDYWRRQLAGAPAMLDLPIDKPRPSVRSYRGTKHRLVIPPLSPTRSTN